ncbi:MAG TPA: hypothetical protein VEL82_07320 [Thermoplasmata archaeon]|nr:hypothetical protein [Thermoplasmata archaeon]
MIRDGKLVCDQCGTPISRITDVPAEGWERLHNLCSACFAQLRSTSVQR